MDQAVADAKKYAADITGILEDMDKQTSSQLGYWTGAAKAEYDSTYKALHDLALSLPAAIDAARQTLENINTTLVDAETLNAKIFAGH
jgi:WXG100 family type VII secretion target